MPFVISSGTLAQTSVVTSPYRAISSNSLQFTDSIFQSYDFLWRTQPALRTVVGFLARNIAQLGIHVFDRVGDDDRARVTDHPLPRLLNRPLPPEYKVTRYRMLNNLMHDIGIYDMAYVVKARIGTGASGVDGLVRIPPQFIYPLGKSWIRSDAYQLLPPFKQQEIPATNIMHFYGYNPQDPRIGTSPIEALRMLLLEEFYSGRYREQMWRNGARATGYIERPVDAPEWGSTARTNFKGDWQAQYAGDGPQAGGTPILEDGMKWVKASFTPEEAQYIEGRKLTRSEVAAVYYIPQSMVGILESATIGSVEDDHKRTYQDALGPWLKMLEEDIDLQLLTDFDGPDSTRYTKFNIAEKLRGSFEEQARSIQALVGAPVLTRNEGRALLERSALPEGDGLVTPLNVLVGGQASPLDSAPPNPSGPEPPLEPTASRLAITAKARVPNTYTTKLATIMASFFGRQGNVVKSKLGGKLSAGGEVPVKHGKAKIDDIWDDARWNSELAADLYRSALLISSAAARKAAAALGFDPADYDEGMTLNWLHEHARGAAHGINGMTKAQVAAALAADDPRQAVADVFASAAGVRAPQIAATETTAMSGFGTSEAAQQFGKSATKTWIATSGKPRPAHAALSGETVDIKDTFSNGARWPGDSLLDDAERANCSCDMEVALQ